MSSVKLASIPGRCEDFAHCLVFEISLGPMHPLVQVAPGAVLGQGVQLTTGLNLVTKFYRRLELHHHCSHDAFTITFDVTSRSGKSHFICVGLQGT